MAVRSYAEGHRIEGPHGHDTLQVARTTLGHGPLRESSDHPIIVNRSLGLYYGCEHVSEVVASVRIELLGVHLVGRLKYGERTRHDH